MTTGSKKKRLDAVEIALTPKEWAIRLADEIRSHPSEENFFQAIIKESFHSSVIGRPYSALSDQAKAKHPGNKPEDIRARAKLDNALRMEYHGLRLLITRVNDAVKTKGEVAGLKAALKLARLETTVLQDAFGRTARKAAEWVEEYKTADAEEEESRQGMLSELAAYADVDYGEKWSDSVPLPGGGRFRFPSFIEDWVAEVTALAAEAFAHRAAVEAVQNQYFDGHPILFQDVEAGLDKTIKTLEEGVETFNAYLQTRAELFKAEWDADEEENEGIASAIPGEREGRLFIDIDAIHASMIKIPAKLTAYQWIKTAKTGAKADIMRGPDTLNDTWNDLRKIVQGKL